VTTPGHKAVGEHLRGHRPATASAHGDAGPGRTSPAIECQAEREGQRCGFKGSAVQGKWINKDDEGE
jgi:hypothetical protein